MTFVWLLSGALGAIGLIGLIYKKTMLGLIVGIQIMILGAGALFVLSGSQSGMQTDGHSFAVFIVLGGLVQIVGGFALATRVFYLKNRTDVSDLRNLKR
jgi:NADH:ubiquinone oxidoreductase subunit K